MLHNRSTGPGDLKVLSRERPFRYRPRSNSLGGEREKTLWNTSSSFRNETVEPTGTASTLGMNVLDFWITVFTIGRGRGVPPSIRLSHTTVPPAPVAPPPVTTPRTVVRTTFATRGGADGASSVRGLV